MNARGSVFVLAGIAALFWLAGGCAKRVASVSDASGLRADRSGAEGPSLTPIEKTQTTPGGDRPLVEMTQEEVQEETIASRGPMGDGGAAASSVPTLVDVFFDYNKATLKRESKTVLQENAARLIRNPALRIQIAGHTDERGSNEYNLALGARRARAVKRFLEALGVAPNRMEVISFGEEKPFCKKSEESCWRLNRRAHFMIQSEG